jgi:hypothetical protein
MAAITVTFASNKDYDFLHRIITPAGAFGVKRYVNYEQ